MRQNPNFTPFRLQNGTYLLPVGQSVSDLRPTLQLNEMGAYIWQLLSCDRTLPELCALCADRFSVPAGQADELRKDILSFLNILNERGMLLAPLPVPGASDHCCHHLSIAGISLNLYGPKEAFSEQFAPFEVTASDDALQNVIVLYGSPASHENGILLIRNKELSILELEEKYILLFHETSLVRELHLKKDGSLALFYCIPQAALAEDMFHAMRFAYLYLAQRHGILAIHSASILYRGYAWLFSAPSGTGKSTHAALWHDILNTPYINGDLNLIRAAGDSSSFDARPVVCGLPWCGTSGICDTASYPLGGIIFLKQAPSDSARPLLGDDRVLAFSRRLISPCWDSQMLEQQIALSQKITANILLCRLFCTREVSALETIRAEIDQYLEISR